MLGKVEGKACATITVVIVVVFVNSNEASTCLTGNMFDLDDCS